MTHEHQPHIELDRELVSAFAYTFIPRWDRYPMQRSDGRYVAVKKNLTDNLVAAHLKGYMTIGAYAVDKNGWDKWICFDADDEKRWKGLLRLAKSVEKSAVIPYREPSRRGGHLWLFTDPLPGFQARRFGRQLLADHKLKGIELYPKQDKAVTGGPGSLVRLPLGIHRLTGKRYHFIDLPGEPLAPTIRDQIHMLARPQFVPQAFIDEVLDRAPAPKVASPTPRFMPKLEDNAGITPSERIKNRISVNDFVTQYVELDPQGRGYCPFHDDQHKSFQVNQAGNYWNCYAGCGGGSIIDFWQKWRQKNGEDGTFTA